MHSLQSLRSARERESVRGERELRLDRLEPGTRLGPYTLKQRLGRGGMGVVYGAHDRAGLEVALKVPLSLRDDHVRALAREAAFLARLATRNVTPRWIASGRAGSVPWLAMQWLAGGTLRARAEQLWGGTASGTNRTTCSGDRGAVRLPSAGGGRMHVVTRIAAQLAEALAEVHRAGVMHGDLKPENVMCEEDGVRLIDLGLAAEISAPGDELSGSSGKTHGTLTYMAPERLLGGANSERGDVYALGCILYELTVGSPPYCGAHHQVRHQHLHARPVPPSSLVSEVEPALERLLDRLLDKDPSRRPSSAAARRVLRKLAR